MNNSMIIDEVQSLKTLLNPATGEKNYFDFEADFVEDNVRCIPMIVRFKLDAVGIKLKLAEWSRFSIEERTFLAIVPVTDAAELAAYKIFLTGLIKKRTDAAPTEIKIDEQPAWNSSAVIPEALQEKAKETGVVISLAQWQRLSKLQRFALLKLCRPGHENKNFPKAMEEFGLTETV